MDQTPQASQSTDQNSPLGQKEKIIQRKWFILLPEPKQNEIVKKAFVEAHSTGGKLDHAKVRKTRDELGE